MNGLRHPALTAFTLAAWLAGITASAHAGESTGPKEVMTPTGPAPSEWQFALAMPTWLAATSGTIGLNGIVSDVYLGADTLLSNLDFTASLSAEARKGPLGIYGDFLYVSASDGIAREGLLEKIDVRLDQTIANMELAYRIVEGPGGWVDVRAGVRYTNLYNRITLAPNDDAIEQASTALVDEIGERVRERLEELNLRERLRATLQERVKSTVTDAIQGVDGKRPILPIAPIGGDRPDRVGQIVRAALERRVDAIAAAMREEAGAATEKLRAAAQARVDQLKKRVAREIAEDIKRELDASPSLSEDWWDPYVGIRARWNIAKAWYLIGKADIGGFGIGSDLTWQASGALGCQITRNLHAELGYRYLFTDYNHDGFEYEVSQSGAELTLGITF